MAEEQDKQVEAIGDDEQKGQFGLQKIYHEIYPNPRY